MVHDSVIPNNALSDIEINSDDNNCVNGASDNSNNSDNSDNSGNSDSSNNIQDNNSDLKESGSEPKIRYTNEHLLYLHTGYATKIQIINIFEYIVNGS